MTRGTLLIVAALLALSACTQVPGVDMSPRPVIRDPSVLSAPEPSAESQSFARYYSGVQSRLLAQGLLRTDGGGPDTPVTQRILVENFERIALFDEYTLRGGRFVAQETPSRLRRWADPVRIQPSFGASVDAGTRATDIAILAAYSQRLAQVSRHPIRQVSSGGNFHVLYLNRDEQRGAAPLLRQLLPDIGEATIRAITSLPRFTFCSVFSFSSPVEPSTYVAAIAIIRTEHPDLLRRSCIHEEVAQGLGLPNDSAFARPSIFNDDEEFALLTTHDELLLRILYDPRLSPGMQPDQARPILRVIAQGLVAGPG